MDESEQYDSSDDNDSRESSDLGRISEVMDRLQNMELLLSAVLSRYFYAHFLIG